MTTRRSLFAKIAAAFVVAPLAKAGIIRERPAAQAPRSDDFCGRMVRLHGGPLDGALVRVDSTARYVNVPMASDRGFGQYRYTLGQDAFWEDTPIRGRSHTMVTADDIESWCREQNRRNWEALTARLG